MPKEVVEEMNKVTFPEAMELILSDKKITRVEWANEKEYGIKKDGFLMLHKADDTFHQWIISDGDMEAEDWIIV